MSTLYPEVFPFPFWILTLELCILNDISCSEREGAVFQRDQAFLSDAKWK